MNLITENSSENGKLKFQQETGNVNVLECRLLFFLIDTSGSMWFELWSVKIYRI